MHTPQGYTEPRAYYVPPGGILTSESTREVRMVSNRTDVRTRAAATRSLRIAMEQKGEARRDALAQHFDTYVPAIFAARTCPTKRA